MGGKRIAAYVSVGLLIIGGTVGCSGSQTATKSRTSPTTKTQATTQTTSNSDSIYDRFVELGIIAAKANQAGIDAEKALTPAFKQIMNGEVNAAVQNLTKAQSLYSLCISEVKKALSLENELIKVKLSKHQSEYIQSKKREAEAALLFAEAFQELSSILLADPYLNNAETSSKVQELRNQAYSQALIVAEEQKNSERIKNLNPSEIR